MIDRDFPALFVEGSGDPIRPQFVTPIQLNAIDPTRLIVGGGNATYESFNQGNT